MQDACNQEGSEKSVKCFKCSGLGHIASECLNQKIISLVEELNESNEGNFDESLIFDNYQK